MKTIYIVFNDRDKVDTCTNLFEDLRFVFEGFVSVKLCFLNEIKPGDISDGDLFLVLYKERVYKMNEYISSLDKVVVMARTFERKYLDDVYAIPSGTDVLVVNDSKESTYQTTNSLYELGLNHLNLIPYIPTEGDEKYNHIRMAITPDEPDSVPDFIEHIINVHNRCIDTNTFITIINKLNLNNPEVTRNLLSYIQRTTGSTGKRYIADNIKDQMLKQTIQESRDSIIIADNTYTAVHFNDKADLTFGLSQRENMSLDLILQEIASELFTEEDYINKLIKFQGINYIVTKTTVRVVDQIIGYSLRFSTETDIKNLESVLNEQLMKKGLFAKYHFDDILYHTEIMDRSVSLAKKIALTDYTILISGESGTGKELLAQSIHNFSARKDNPFVAINCAALPESLLESELFGYEKGAFTGASRQGKIGLFEQANHGTIFLDEIGDMSLNLQARLLRVLQEKQITRLGSDKVINLDIRVLAATNKNLPEAIKHKEFREDLYYRLCNIPIAMPSLRERSEDIPFIFRRFVGDKYQILSEKEIHALKTYPWPGNVRELKNAADYFITLGELPQNIMAEALSKVKEDILLDSPNQNLQSPLLESASMPDSQPGVSTENFVNPLTPLGSLSAEEAVLSIIANNTSEASGIGRTAILQKLKIYGINLSDDRLRKLLHRLEAEEKIIIGRGRTGCMIK